jgi:enoyl-CoA hydratase
MERTPPAVSWEMRGEVAVLTLASPPSNVLDERLASGLATALDGIEASAASVLVVRSAVPGHFATGADAGCIETIDRSEFIALLRSVREAIEALASSAVISIAAIEGRALGGGLELALACTLRVAAPEARLGLPEVKLGLLPGGGGTQRLPRLVGRANALDLLITGRSVSGEEARAMSLIDALSAPGGAEQHAIALATRLAGFSRPALAGITRCVDVAQSLPFAEGMAVEADEIVALFSQRSTAGS